MNRRHRTGPAIGHEYGHTVGGPDAQRSGGIGGDGDVSARPPVARMPWAESISVGAVENIGAGHLLQSHERVGVDAERPGELPPAVTALGEVDCKIPGAETVRRHVGERAALERPSPRLLHPFELAGRLWEGHVYQYY